MKRWKFLALLCGAAAWPLAALAQQSAKPVIGYLDSRAPGEAPQFSASFREGLKENGFNEGENVAIEYRFAENHNERLPALATDLVHRRVGPTPAALAAKAATADIPIVFVTGGDPVRLADPFFTARQVQLATLAASHGVPAVYENREFAAAGGLVSYGGSLPDAVRVMGVYAARILKGEKPADLPVQRATKVELYINMKTAKTLGISVPIPILGRADEVIE